MRSYVTFFVIAVLTLVLSFSLLTRNRAPYDAPAEVLVLVDGGDAGLEGGALAIADGGARAEAAAPPPVPTVKPLRVVSLGWELALAAVPLVTSPPGAPPAMTPPMELAPETTLDAVEARLARGGADPQGADVAIVPLPAFVASYEKLRALEPRIFLVVGFSRGREEVRATPGALLKPPAGDAEVKLAALPPKAPVEADGRASGTESATFVGLFALDLLGVPPSRVRILGPATPEAKDLKAVPYAAVVRGAAEERKLAFSTADASRLVPFVAVASRGVLEGRTKELETWSKAWLEGFAKAGKQAPEVARRLATKEGIPFAGGVGGAPEAIHLIERLGQIEPATLATQYGLDGTEAGTGLTMSLLTQRTWQLARQGGQVTVAAPDPLPLETRVVAAVAPSAKDGGATAPSTASAEVDAGATFAPIPAGATALVVYRADTTADAAQVAAQIGFLAGVFERAMFRVSAKGGERAARAIAATAQARFDLPATRLSTAAAEPTGAFAAVETFSPP